MKTIGEVYGKDYVFVDVRSPQEFAEDHIPGAVNIPLFDNDERAIVGTLYTKQSREDAIDKGVEIFADKLPQIMQTFKPFRGKKLCVYCWRGGMRSGAIVGLLQGLKFDVVQLAYGYKAYRTFVREQLEKISLPPFVVLYGMTGTGKTEILEALDNSLDLEGLAQHRASIFGDIGLEPRSQKMFDSGILQRLLELKDEPFVFVEGESRRIGRVLIPEPVWKQMQGGQQIKVVATMDERVERIYRIYCDDFDAELFKQKTRYIDKYIGKKKVEQICSLIDQGKIKEFLRVILEDYYDRLYAHTVDSKQYAYEVRNKEELDKIFLAASE